MIRFITHPRSIGDTHDSKTNNFLSSCFAEQIKEKMFDTFMVTLREKLEAKRSLPKILNILKIWGPAWLVMIADVDAASVITAAESGAVYGTKLIWFLMILAL